MSELTKYKKQRLLIAVRESLDSATEILLVLKKFNIGDTLKEKVEKAIANINEAWYSIQEALAELSPLELKEE
jgi:DNA/RNA endonuclease YhcR with UshA esterase domain